MRSVSSLLEKVTDVRLTRQRQCKRQFLLENRLGEGIAEANLFLWVVH